MLGLHTDNVVGPQGLGGVLPHKSHWLKLVTWSHLTAQRPGNVFLSVQQREENWMWGAHGSLPQAPKFPITLEANRKKGNECEGIFQVSHPAVSLLYLLWADKKLAIYLNSYFQLGSSSSAWLSNLPKVLQHLNDKVRIKPVCAWL